MDRGVAHATGKAPSVARPMEECDGMRKIMIAVSGVCLMTMTAVPVRAQGVGDVGQQLAQQTPQQRLDAEYARQKAAAAEQKRRMDAALAEGRALKEESDRKQAAAEAEQAKLNAAREAEDRALATLFSKAGYWDGDVGNASRASLKKAVKAFESDFFVDFSDDVRSDGRLSDKEHALLSDYVERGATSPREYYAMTLGFENLEAMNKERLAQSKGFPSAEAYENALSLGMEDPNEWSAYHTGRAKALVEGAKTFVTEHQSEVPTMDLLPYFAILDPFLKESDGKPLTKEIVEAWDSARNILRGHPDFQPYIDGVQDAYGAKWMASLEVVKQRFAENMALADAFIQKDLFDPASLRLVRFREEKGLNKPDPSLVEIRRFNRDLESYLVATGIREPEPGTVAPAVHGVSKSGRPLVEIPEIGLVPDWQAEFVAVVAKAQQASKAAKNDMQRGAIKAQRDRELCAIPQYDSLVNWTGVVRDISANSDGMGVLVLAIGEDVTVETHNNALSDMLQDYPTLISPDSEVFAQAMNLARGDRVVFTGKLREPLDEHDCIAEKSLTLRGKLAEPQFVITFMKLELAD
jgi:hypothetical protein